MRPHALVYGAHSGGKPSGIVTATVTFSKVKYHNGLYHLTRKPGRVGWVCDGQRPTGRSSRPARCQSFPTTSAYDHTSALATMPRFSVVAAVFALLASGACTDAPTGMRPAALPDAGSAVALTAQLQPTPQSATAMAAQFRWIEPVGTGGNALGHSDNAAAYLPFLRVELCEIASPAAACGAVVPGSVAVAGGGLALTANGKAYAATLRARDLPLDPARDYRLRVVLVDPQGTGAGVQVGYQNVDVSAGGKESARDGFYRINTKQSLPVKFILGPGVVRTIAIRPALDTLTIGTTRVYTATAMDWEGRPVPGAAPTWLTADPAIAGVNGSGLVSAASLGLTTLYATIDGLSASQPVRVITPVVSVTLTQAPANPVTAGTLVTFTATARDAGGNVVTSRPFTWTGAAGSGATATFTPAAAGSFPVSVTVDGISASVTVEAVAASDPNAVATIGLGAAVVTLNVGDQPTAPIYATLWDARGVPLEGRTVTWSSSNPAVISVNGSGYLNALAPGYAYVTATSEGKSAKLVAIVTPVGGGVGNTVGSIVVLPPQATITAPDTVRLVAVVLDVNGSPMANQNIGWTKGNNAVTLDDVHGQTVLATGVPSATQQAFVNVTAMVPVSDPRGSVNGISQITVLTPSSPPGPSGGTIIITPNPVNATVGQNVTLTADVRDEQGNPVAGLPLIWTIGNAQVASVSGSGYAATLSALGAGLTSVRATSGALTGTAAVNVSAGPQPPEPVTSLAVSPLAATIGQNSCVQLTATYTVDGVASDVTSLAGWQRGSDKLQPITNGLVCGAGNITNGRNAIVNVTVSYLGLQQTATITVTP